MLHIRLHPFPVLQTARLRLRRVTHADVPAIFSMRSSPELMRYLDRTPAQSEDEALELFQKIDGGLRNNDGITWAITEHASPELIGSIGYWRIDKDNHRAEVGYMLQQRHHRKGYMQEALHAVLRYGFTDMRLHSVEANVNPHNQASIGLLLRNGFVKEAHFKENYYYDGKFLDSVIYSLLSHQFPHTP